MATEPTPKRKMEPSTTANGRLVTWALGIAQTLLVAMILGLGAYVFGQLDDHADQISDHEARIREVGAEVKNELRNLREQIENLRQDLRRYHRQEPP